MIHLFVYGTLRPHFRSEWGQMMLEGAVNIGAGSTPGVMYDLGAFPAVVFAEGSDRVFGDVLRISEKQLPQLDRYEGHPHLFERREVTVLTTNGEMQCQAYEWAYPKKFSEGEKVPSGVWS